MFLSECLWNRWYLCISSHTFLESLILCVYMEKLGKAGRTYTIIRWQSLLFRILKLLIFFPHGGDFLKHSFPQAYVPSQYDLGHCLKILLSALFKGLGSDVIFILVLHVMLSWFSKCTLLWRYLEIHVCIWANCTF